MCLVRTKPSFFDNFFFGNNPVKITLLSMSSRSSVDRVPAQCLRGLGFNSCQDSDFFFVPCSCHVDQFTFHTSLPSSKFTIFIYLSGQFKTQTADCRPGVKCRLRVNCRLQTADQG